jgi:hypothetical protein
VNSLNGEFDPQKYRKAEIGEKEPYREMVVFMDGSKKRIKGGTSEFGIKVPPILRRCHLQVCGGKSMLESLITEGNKQKWQSRFKPCHCVSLKFV